MGGGWFSPLFILNFESRGKPNGGKKGVMKWFQDGRHGYFLFLQNKSGFPSLRQNSHD